MPVEPPDLDAISERCDAATPGPWDARWAEPKDEPDRLAKAILLSTEHDRQSATSSTAWRLIAGDDDWVNLGFFGNGLTSKDNALFIAHAREDVPALAAALVAARERAETAEKMFFDTIALDLEHVERARAAEAEVVRLREALERLVYRDDEILWSAASWAAARAALADTEETNDMTDPVEPPEVAAWKQATLLKNQTDEFNIMRTGNALAAALVAAREEYEIAHRGRTHDLRALRRERDEAGHLRKELELILDAGDEADRLREALRAIFDSVVLDRGGIERTDAITSARAALAATEETKP